MKSGKYSLVNSINIFLSLLILSSGISYLKISFSGVVIDRSGGSLFLYELILILLLLQFMIYFLKYGKIEFSKKIKEIIMIVCLINVPIFIFHLILSTQKINAYFGNGQLRLLLLTMMLFVFLAIYPKRLINNQLIIKSILIIGFINSSYAILSQLGLVEQLYFFTTRIPFLERQSGLFSVPVSLGVISVICLIIVNTHNKRSFLTSLIMNLVYVCGLILSMSNTAWICLGVGIILVNSKLLFKNALTKTLTFLLLVSFATILLYSATELIADNVSRIDSISETLFIWYNNYGLGIPWGEMNNYLSGVEGVIPHNWIISSLLYGGTISGLATIYIFIASFKKFIKDGKKNEKSRKQIFGIILIILFVASIFEQTFILVPTIFIQYIFIVLTWKI